MWRACGAAQAVPGLCRRHGEQETEATEMTTVDERRMTELFENLEVPEGVKVELLRGEIVLMAGPDLVHNPIVEAVFDQIPREKWHR
ncbi:hypothetical protein GCM10012285_21900 [Streptomyces kronopolitis]|uniref:Restriction endonuclease domain-containing protein n=1 Tax=Streptomyces kronopolitis TaxID=1612435 RepID=A0ABQ2J8U7_9ACTN|nr:hypothetical protein GCM10012285_21900 [Streptomyces kronopolitis]